MSPADPNVAWPVALVITSMIGFVYGWVSHRYRKGCNECDAAMRRAVELRAKIEHDNVHRGLMSCEDKSCPQNEKRVNSDKPEEE